MSCKHESLELGDVTGEYHCGYCGRRFGRLAPVQNSPVPTQSTEPILTELFNQILPLVTATMSQSTQATQSVQILQTAKAIQALTVAVEGMTVTGTMAVNKILNSLIARLEKLLLDANSQVEETPVP